MVLRIVTNNTKHKLNFNSIFERDFSGFLNAAILAFMPGKTCTYTIIALTDIVASIYARFFCTAFTLP